MFQYASEWTLTPYRLAVHGPTKTAVIADLHLGYSDARRHCGDAVPRVSIEEQLAPLKTACAVLDLEQLVVAGDLCEARLDAGLVERFTSFVAGCGLKLRAVVRGNHDRGWQDFRDRLPMRGDGIKLGIWSIVHGDGVLPAGPIVMGHVHPAWRSGSRIASCFLIGANRLILPAFSNDAAGGAVNHVSRWAGYQVLSIEGERVVDRGPLKPTKNPRRGKLRGFRR